jgi:phenylalanyl-tRNA synthetase alpha chain
MVAFLNELKHLEESFAKEFSQAKSADDLEKIKVGYLGRKGRLTFLLRDLKNLSEEEKPAIGKRANEIKEGMEKRLKERFEELKVEEKKSKEQSLDYTLPGRRIWTAKLHPLTLVMNEVIEIFYGMGFEVVKGPDVETEYYNFDALNFPKDHPARDMMDTFYIDENLLLRTHTSPVQVRVFEKRKPPVRILAPGRVYRNEAINARSYCVFHQVEGFYVDYDVTFADLKGVLTAFAQKLFGKDVKLRFRASFFPFTEPSAEIDISCVICGGRGCSVCKFRGWLEILGAGMIDPEVFRGVSYDPEVYSGYAFGLGIDRIAMLKYRINDVRLFFENDLRFLRQF